MTCHIWTLVLKASLFATWHFCELSEGFACVVLETSISLLASKRVFHAINRAVTLTHIPAKMATYATAVRAYEVSSAQGFFCLKIFWNNFHFMWSISCRLSSQEAQRYLLLPWMAFSRTFLLLPFEVLLWRANLHASTLFHLCFCRVKKNWLWILKMLKLWLTC